MGVGTSKPAAVKSRKSGFRQTKGMKTRVNRRMHMHYPFSVIALRRDQRTEGRETGKASTPNGPGRDAIAKSVMVYTAVPPDYCDNDVGIIVQQAPSDVNSLKKTLSSKRKARDSGEGNDDPLLRYWLSALRYPAKLCYGSPR